MVGCPYPHVFKIDSCCSSRDVNTKERSNTEFVDRCGWSDEFRRLWTLGQLELRACETAYSMSVRSRSSDGALTDPSMNIPQTGWQIGRRFDIDFNKYGTRPTALCGNHHI